MTGLTPKWELQPQEGAQRELWRRFLEEGLPDNRQVEAWKYTNLRTLAQAPIDFSLHPEAGSVATSFSNALVFVDGHLDESLSSVESEGVRWFKDSLQKAEGPLDLLNAATSTASLRVEIEGEQKSPLVLHFIASSPEADWAASPRLEINLGPNAKAVLCEVFESQGAGKYFTNVVENFHLEAGARLEQVRLQRESQEAFHLSQQRVLVKEDAAFVSHYFSMGGRLSRNDLAVDLIDPGASCQLNGLFFGSGEQHQDCRTTIRHQAPHCQSEELYKGIAGGSSTGIFDGRVVVEKDAQQTVSAQTNRNLLLSEEAQINAKPQLEIYADDVKCSHGATTGQLDKAAIFYLRSRGIGEREARQILTSAFAAELVDRVPDERLRQEIQAALIAKWEAVHAG